MIETKTLFKNNEPIVSGFFIGIPYEVGTPEWEAVKDMLGEIWSENTKRYLIQQCGECDECGAINRTVEEVEPEQALCEFCESY